MKRVCILTGASGVLGRAFIERFAGEYEIVGVHHRQPVRFATQDQRFVDPLRPGAELAANDDPVQAIQADLSRPEEISRVVEETLADCGRVDLLVNAAAMREWAHLFDPRALASAESMLDLNVLTPLRLATCVAEQFWRADPDGNARERRGVVNVSSSAGLFVYPDSGQALYATSKAALNHLTHHMASEFWNLGVRVNAVAPDTFPGRVPLESVLDAVHDLDHSEATGEIVRLLEPAR